MKQFLPILMLALACGFPNASRAQTTFTYQGRLGNAGQAANGAHDFVFRLFDAETAGNQIGSDLAVAPIDVADGIFTVQLDFGDAPFNSAPRWLEVDVRQSGGAAYTTLDPRQRIGASPFAIETLMVAPGAIDTAALQDGAVTSAKIADGAVTRQRMANNAVDTAVIADGTVTTNDIRDNNITSPKFAVGAVDSRAIADGAVASAEIGTAAVTSDKIANQSIAAIDLASGSVGTDEIIDGTITPADVSGGLYSRKGQLYLRESSVLVTFNKNETSVSCDDSNDLLVIAVCNAESPNNSLRLVQRQLFNIDHDVLPVELRCQMENDNPTVGQRFSATVGCVAVP